MLPLELTAARMASCCACKVDALGNSIVSAYKTCLMLYQLSTMRSVSAGGFVQGRTSLALELNA